MNKQLIFSGIQPSGSLTIGNYMGALKGWAQLQQDKKCIYCVVDQHAITTFQDPEKLKDATREVTAGIIASGVDIKKTILFNQSKNPNHTELGWYLNCVASMGWLSRMTQFKEKSGGKSGAASVGLFAYPALQAADILLYRATEVPVGHDQKQHLELCRDIAIKFNFDYKTDFFPVIEPIIKKEAARVMSLKDGLAKMSKSDPSDNSRINLLDTADTIIAKFKKAKSDQHILPMNNEGLDGRPEAKNLITIYADLQNKTINEVMDEVAGKGWSEFKTMLGDLAVEVIVPIGHEMRRLLKDKHQIDEILKRGAIRAREISEPNIKKVRDIIGFL